MVTVTVREENGDFCVAVAPATRTAGILTQLVNALAVKLSRPPSRSGSYTGLIGFNLRRLKWLKGMSSHATDLCEIFLFLSINRLIIFVINYLSNRLR